MRRYSFKVRIVIDSVWTGRELYAIDLGYTSRWDKAIKFCLRVLDQAIEVMSWR